MTSKVDMKVSALSFMAVMQILVSDSEAYLAIIVVIMSKSENLFFATDAFLPARC